MLLVDWWSKAIAEFPRTVETGTSGMELAFGSSLWEFFERNPREGEGFALAVQAAHAGEKEAVAEIYDFSAFDRVVDVAGGTGLLLAEVLRRHPKVTGVLFDLPAVIADSTGELDELRDRCETVAGDFFESVSAGSDCYVLSHVIHDWDDDRCVQILRNCRQAMEPTGGCCWSRWSFRPGTSRTPARCSTWSCSPSPGAWSEANRSTASCSTRPGSDLRKSSRPRPRRA